MTNTVQQQKNYVGAGVILTRTDGATPRFLCLQGRETGVWSFSKGRAEPCDGGAPLRTAVRETQEETGLMVGQDYTIVGNSVRYGKRPYWVGVVAANAVQRITLAGREHVMAAWLTAEEIGRLNGNTDMRAWAKKMANGLGTGTHIMNTIASGSVPVLANS